MSLYFPPIMIDSMLCSCCNSQPFRLSMKSSCSNTFDVLSDIVAVGMGVSVSVEIETGVKVADGAIADCVMLEESTNSVSLASAVSVDSIGSLAIALSVSLFMMTPIKETMATRRRTKAEGVRKRGCKISCVNGLS